MRSVRSFERPDGFSLNFQILLFATQICHIIVLVETGKVFDASYLSMFKALKTIRERYVLKFLPKLLKNSNAGAFMGKDGRLCSPRIIFMFERCLLEYSRLRRRKTILAINEFRNFRRR